MSSEAAEQAEMPLHMSLDGINRIDDLNLRDKVVIIRCDTDITSSDDPDQIQNHERMVSMEQAVKSALDAGAKMICVIGHRGRDKGAKAKPIMPIAQALEARIGQRVLCAENLSQVSDVVRQAQTEDVKVVMLQNSRSDPREKAKDIAEREAYATETVEAVKAGAGCTSGDVSYGQASFASLQNDGDASMMQLPKACAGGRYVDQTVVAELRKAAEAVKRSKVIFVSGAKPDKANYIKGMIENNPDVTVVLGGGLAAHALALKGHCTQTLKADDEDHKALNEVLTMSEDARHGNVILPEKVRVIESVQDSKEVVTRLKKNEGKFPMVEKSVDELLETDLIVDMVGSYYSEGRVRSLVEQTRDQGMAAMVSGPAGIVESDDGQEGTKALAQILSDTRINIFLVGGDTLALGDRGIDFGDTATGITGGGSTLRAFVREKFETLEALAA